MLKALHVRDVGHRLYVSRKEESRGLTSMEDCVDASIQRIDEYLEMHDCQTQKWYWQHEDQQNDNN